MTVGKTAYKTENDFEIATVETIDEDKAVCVTQYGGEVEIYWDYGIPAPAPKPGDTWKIRRQGKGVWSFDTRRTTGYVYANRTSVIVHVEECLGIADTVADNLKSMGVHGVYLVVAEGGKVWWDSDNALDYGLDYEPDVADGLVERFRMKGLAVSLCIGADLWNDVDDESHNRYQQRVWSPSGYSYAPKMSWSAAMQPMYYLCEELKNLFYTSCDGIVLLDVGLASRYADFNQESMRDWYEANGARADRTYVDESSDNWEDRFTQWVGFQYSQFKDLVGYVKSAVGLWPVGVIADESFGIGPSGHGFGKIWSGLSLELSSDLPGVDIVGSRSLYDPDDCESRRMTSLELSIAFCARFGLDCSPVLVLDGKSLENAENVYSAVSRYRVSRVLVESYSSIMSLNADETRRFSETLDRYRLLSVPYESRSIGVYVGQDSADWLKDGERAEWLSQILSICRAVGDRVDARFDVVTDKDMGWARNVDYLDAILLHRPVFDNSDIETVLVGFSSRSDVDFVLTGDDAFSRSRYGAVDMSAARWPNRAFGISFGGRESVSGRIALDGIRYEGDDRVVELGGDLSFPKLVRLSSVGECVASSLEDGTSGDAVPIIRVGDSFYVATSFDPSLVDIVAELVSIAAERS